MYGGPMWAILSASRYSWRIIPFNESHAFYVRSYWSFREGRGSASPATEGELCNITFPNFYFSIYSIFYQLNTLVKFDKWPPPPTPQKKNLTFVFTWQSKKTKYLEIELNIPIFIFQFKKLTDKRPTDPLPLKITFLSAISNKILRLRAAGKKLMLFNQSLEETSDRVELLLRRLRWRSRSSCFYVYAIPVIKSICQPTLTNQLKTDILPRYRRTLQQVKLCDILGGQCM